MLMTIALLIACTPPVRAGGQLSDARIPNRMVHEIVLKTAGSYANPYLETGLEAVFTAPTGEVKRVLGFCDGGDLFKIRFTPTMEGRWRIDTKSPDAGLNGWKGMIQVTPAPKNAHGFLRRDPAYPHHWIWDDGSRYFMVGQTYYEIISNALGGDTWKLALDQCRKYGINKVRFRLSVKTCGVADNGFSCTMPWEGGNPDKLDLNHFRATDAVVGYMYKTGMVADLMPFNSMERAFGTAEQDLRFLRYVIARYAAYPNVIWCLTNEFQRTGRTLEYLNTLGDRLRAEDPWIQQGEGLRPLSIHPLGRKGEGDLFKLGNRTWPVHVILQTGRFRPGDPQQYSDMVANRRFGMPVVNDEFGYMGDTLGAWGRDAGYSRELHRNSMWAIYMAGGYASTGDKNKYPHGRPYKSSIWHEQPEYEDIANLVKLFTTKGVEYWKAQPDAADVLSGGRVYLLSQPGVQYLAYAASGGAFSLGLAEGHYSVRLYNPRNGSETDLPDVDGGERTFETLAGTDWVIYMKRRHKP